MLPCVGACAAGPAVGGGLLLGNQGPKGSESLRTLGPRLVNPGLGGALEEGRHPSADRGGLPLLLFLPEQPICPFDRATSIANGPLLAPCILYAHPPHMLAGALCQRMAGH